MSTEGTAAAGGPSTVVRLPTELLLTLRVGIFADELEAAGAVLDPVLGVPLQVGDDLELGGAYLSWTGDLDRPPSAGARLVGVRVHSNRADVIGARPRGRMPWLADIELLGLDLLALGRLADRLPDPRTEVAGYVVAPGRPGTEGTELPAALVLELPLRGDEPRLLCWAAVDVLGGDPAGVAATSGVLANGPEVAARWTVTAGRTGALRAELALTSPSVLTVGQAAARIEDAWPGSRVAAWRIAGELLGDGVPRLLAAGSP